MDAGGGSSGPPRRRGLSFYMGLHLRMTCFSLWGKLLTKTPFHSPFFASDALSKIARMCSVRYRYSRYRYGYRTELIEVSGTGVDVVLSLPKCPEPVLMFVPKLPNCPVLVIPAVCLGTCRTEHTLSYTESLTQSFPP